MDKQAMAKEFFDRIVAALDLNDDRTVKKIYLEVRLAGLEIEMQDELQRRVDADLEEDAKLQAADLEAFGDIGYPYLVVDNNDRHA